MIERFFTPMQLLETRINKDGIIKAGNVLKVDSFLNHQIDVSFLRELGEEFYRLFNHCGVNKILTIESSGIGIACITAQFFNCPVVFAKKSKSSNISPDVYSATIESYTHGNTYSALVSKEYLTPADKVLIIDDFLATGSALFGLLDIVKQSGAEIIGCGIVIEKAFQPGGAKVRDTGIRVESLARIASMSPEHGCEFIR